MAEIIRHRKTGGLYEVLHRVAAIYTYNPRQDYDLVLVCQDSADGEIAVCSSMSHAPVAASILYAAIVQSDVALFTGSNVVVYRALRGGPVWVRPTSEMDDGRFEPVDAVGAPETTLPGGEVEEAAGRLMVDRLIAASEQRSRVLRGIVTSVSLTEAEKVFQDARTALLAVVRSSGGGGLAK